jgi:hypothetical protein
VRPAEGLEGFEKARREGGGQMNLVNGALGPSLATLDGPAALARKREVEARLGAIRNDPSRVAERAALKAENVALDARLREHREETKRDNARRNFAGLGSPLHEALVERLPPALVAELEALALAKLADRERRTAERKAAKAAPSAPEAAGPPNGPKPAPGGGRAPGQGPEVIVRRAPGAPPTVASGKAPA